MARSQVGQLTELPKQYSVLTNWVRQALIASVMLHTHGLGPETCAAAWTISLDSASVASRATLHSSWSATMLTCRELGYPAEPLQACSLAQPCSLQ